MTIQILSNFHTGHPKKLMLHFKACFTQIYISLNSFFLPKYVPQETVTMNDDGSIDTPLSTDHSWDDGKPKLLVITRFLRSDTALCFFQSGRHNASSQIQIISPVVEKRL